MRRRLSPFFDQDWEEFEPIVFLQRPFDLIEHWTWLYRNLRPRHEQRVCTIDAGLDFVTPTLTHVQVVSIRSDHPLPHLERLQDWLDARPVFVRVAEEHRSGCGRRGGDIGH
jgi:hypothetical protein